MVTLAEQHAFNISPGPFFEPADALPAVAPTDHPVRFIAY